MSVGHPTQPSSEKLRDWPVPKVFVELTVFPNKFPRVPNTTPVKRIPNKKNKNRSQVGVARYIANSAEGPANI